MDLSQGSVEVVLTKLPPKKRQRGPRCWNWFFTDNGEAGTNGERLRANPEVWTVLPAGVRYLSWQLEEGEVTKHPHLQGHIELTCSQYVSWLHTHISTTASFLVRKGSASQCDVYCHKEKGRLAGPFSLGTPKKKAKKASGADLVDLLSLCEKQVPWRQMIMDDPTMVHKYLRLLEKMKAIYRPKYDPDGEGARVILLFGIAGCGKTKQAYDHWKEEEGFYELPLTGCSTVWWDGLDGHNRILFDDFCGSASHMRLDNFLKIIDRYPRRVQVKGSHEWLSGDKHVIITSNLHPRKWWKWEGREPQWPALKRRIHQVFVWKNGDMVEADSDFWGSFEEDPLFSVYGRCNHEANYCVNFNKCKKN